MKVKSGQMEQNGRVYHVPDVYVRTASTPATQGSVLQLSALM